MASAHQAFIDPLAGFATASTATYDAAGGWDGYSTEGTEDSRELFID